MRLCVIWLQPRDQTAVFAEEGPAVSRGSGQECNLEHGFSLKLVNQGQIVKAEYYCDVCSE